MNHSNTDDSAGAPDSQEDDRVMPLGVGGFENEGADVATEPAKRNFSSGTILIALVIVLAAGGLYSMRSIAKAMAAAKSGDQDLEATIETFLNSITGNEGDFPGLEIVGGAHASAGDMLLNDRTERQVPLDSVQKNPFILPLEPKAEAPVAAPVTPMGETEEERLAAARDEARVGFEKAAAKLRLGMILGGRDPMANIGGRIVRVGDILADEKLDVEFTVMEISAGFVVIRGSDSSIDFRHDITLTLLGDDSDDDRMYDGH